MGRVRVLLRKTKNKKIRDKFYKSEAWKKARYQKLKETNYCECCGKEKGDETESGSRVKLSVDHIKPRSLYPELELDINNLQILCQNCGAGKGNWDETDWRIKNKKNNEL